MIELAYNKGNVFVYKVNDWLELRKKHRIIGEIIGNTHFIPSLPLQLKLEEVLVLLDKNVAVVRKIDNTKSANDKQKHEEFEANLLQCEINEYRKIRKEQLEGILDKIVENRRQNNDERTREEILEEELNKSTVVTKENMVWPVQMLNNTRKYLSEELVNFDEIYKATSELKWLTFKDLWEKGYYITCGHRFGGDFLVYKGDPLVFHAIFIVHCLDSNRQLFGNEIVAYGRLSTSVRKKAVLASLVDGKVSYITLNWIDS